MVITQLEMLNLHSILMITQILHMFILMECMS